ncbi:MAG: type II toxin-antitoxin system HicA family toxin [Chloroflexota bacterium]|nr:type II toxin-antitoxin system HicA family toxin [Chloroflexota bacterium]
MSARLPRVTGTEVLRALERAGWQRVHQVGSHIHLRHPQQPGRVTIPIHRGKTLKLNTLASILKQAGLTPAEFSDLL